MHVLNRLLGFNKNPMNMKAFTARGSYSRIKTESTVFTDMVMPFEEINMYEWRCFFLEI